MANGGNTLRYAPRGRQDFLRKGVCIMSEVTALAVANTLTKAALPLIQSATPAQTQGSASGTSSTEDMVSISSEAKELQGHHG